MKKAERCVLTTDKAPVIRSALSAVLAGVKSEGDITPGTRERIEAFARAGCARLVLDLRMVKGSPGCMSQGVKNLRVSHFGQVLVVTGEVTGPGILHEIEALRRPHFSPQYLASALLALIHMLF